MSVHYDAKQVDPVKWKEHAGELGTFGITEIFRIALNRVPGSCGTVTEENVDAVTDGICATGILSVYMNAEVGKRMGIDGTIRDDVMKVPKEHEEYRGSARTLVRDMVGFHVWTE